MTNESIFREAMNAIAQGQRARARDLLTRLLRTDQSNAEYWLWMSAAVDTAQERIYCLETIMRMDPGNQVARRGLMLMGAIPAPETMTPSPLPRRRWGAAESQAAATDVRQLRRHSSLTRLMSTPAARPIIFGGAAVGLVLVVLVILQVTGVFSGLKKRSSVASRSFPTPIPLSTYTPTSTVDLSKPSPTLPGPTPLGQYLHITKTPAPRYVETPHPYEAYRVGLRSWDAGNYSDMIQRMREASDLQPSSPDLLYYLCLAYYLNKQYDLALTSCDQAITADATFAPAYLQRARVLQVIEPASKAAIQKDIQKALQLDPNFPDSYLAWASEQILDSDITGALQTLRKAEQLAPNNPAIPILRSQAYLAQGKNDLALNEAQRAHDMDLTSLEAYLALGTAYFSIPDYPKVVEYLYTYLLFVTDDSDAWALYGRALFLSSKDQLLVLEALDRALTLDQTNHLAYYYRALIYLELEDASKAVKDLLVALRYLPKDFSYNFALGKAFLMAKRYNDAYQQLSSSLKYAETDAERAQVYYWRAKTLEAAGNPTVALADWQALLALSKGSAPAEWLSEAKAHIPTATATATSTITLTQRPSSPTPTATSTRKPTVTTTPTTTRRPTLTLSPTPSLKPSVTLSPTLKPSGP